MHLFEENFLILLPCMSSFLICIKWILLFFQLFTIFSFFKPVSNSFQLTNMFLKIWYLEPDALPLESVFLNFTDEGVLSIVFTEMVFTVIWYLVVLILFHYWLMTEFSLAVQLLHPLKAVMDIIFPVDLFLDLDHNNIFFLLRILWLPCSMQIFVISIC